MADLLGDPLTPIRERTALALTILAGLGDGKDAIVQNHTILGNLTVGLGDIEPSVRLKIAACLEMLARSWMGYCFVPFLRKMLIFF